MARCGRSSGSSKAEKPRGLEPWHLLGLRAIEDADRIKTDPGGLCSTSSEDSSHDYSLIASCAFPRFGAWLLFNTGPGSDGRSRLDARRGPGFPGSISHSSQEHQPQAPPYLNEHLGGHEVTSVTKAEASDARGTVSCPAPWGRTVAYQSSLRLPSFAHPVESDNDVPRDPEDSVGANH